MKASNTCTTVRLTEALLYDMEPLVAIGLGNDGLYYLCVAVHDSTYSNPYICFSISSDDTRLLKYNKVDVKTLMLGSSVNCWFVCDVRKDKGNIVKTFSHREELPESYIPEDDLFVGTITEDQQ